MGPKAKPMKISFERPLEYAPDWVVMRIELYESDPAGSYGAKDFKNEVGFVSVEWAGSPIDLIDTGEDPTAIELSGMDDFFAAYQQWLADNPIPAPPSPSSIAQSAARIPESGCSNSIRLAHRTDRG